MVIDISGNGSMLFQSLDPTDQSLYTWAQDDSAVFVPVTNVKVQGNVTAQGNVSVQGNVSAQQNVYANNVIANNYYLGSTLIKPPTVTILSGNNISNNYAPPAGVLWLKVRMVGGGGGGSQWDNANNGANATASIFGNSSMGSITCGGGAGSGANGAASYFSGGGGVISIVSNAAWNVFSSNGSTGQGGMPCSVSGVDTVGGMGGVTPFGGGGGSSFGSGGYPGVPGTGSGGGGGGATSTGSYSGGGGGAGAYAEIWITQIAPLYPYTVGAYGPGGASVAGGYGPTPGCGANGAYGSIIIEEHYV